MKKNHDYVSSLWVQFSSIMHQLKQVPVGTTMRPSSRLRVEEEEEEEEEKVVMVCCSGGQYQWSPIRLGDKLSIDI